MPDIEVLSDIVILGESIYGASYLEQRRIIYTGEKLPVKKETVCARLYDLPE